MAKFLSLICQPNTQATKSGLLYELKVFIHVYKQLKCVHLHEDAMNLVLREISRFK